MPKFLMASAPGALLAACSLLPQTAASAPEAAFTATAETQVAPEMEWRSAGDDRFFYHMVWGDCAFLEHGHGRNNSWGRWRILLGLVSHAGVEAADDNASYAVTFTCTDGSACVQTGELHDTPGRTDAHTIPFETQQDAERYLADVASLDESCKALK